MRKIKKCVVIFLGSALLIGFLAGALQAKKTMSYMNWFLTLQDKAMTEAQLEAFEKANPDVQVKWIPVPFGDYQPKLLTMVAGGIAPDTFWAWPIFAPEIWDKRVIYPMNEFIEKDPTINWEDVMFKEILGGKLYDGDIIGLPSGCAASCYFYNKDTFQEAGLADPADLYYQGKWDWDTYMALGPKLSKDIDGDGRMDTFTNVASFWWNVFNNTGADMYNEDGTKCTLDSPETVQAVQFLVDEITEGLVPPPQFEAAKVGMSFETGRVAMRSIWVYFIFSEQFINLPFNWGVVMPWFGPKGPEKASAGGSVATCISRAAEDKALAYNFIKFLISEEAFLAELNTPGVVAMPSRYSQFKLPAYTEAVEQLGHDTKMISDIWEQGGMNGGPRNSIAGFFGWQVWIREMDNAKRGIKTVEEACKDAAREIQARIDEILEE